MEAIDSGEEKLRKLGYKQEFKRDFNMYRPLLLRSLPFVASDDAVDFESDVACVTSLQICTSLLREGMLMWDQVHQLCGKGPAGRLLLPAWAA